MSAPATAAETASNLLKVLDGPRAGSDKREKRVLKAAGRASVMPFSELRVQATTNSSLLPAMMAKLGTARKSRAFYKLTEIVATVLVLLVSLGSSAVQVVLKNIPYISVTTNMVTAGLTVILLVSSRRRIAANDLAKDLDGRVRAKQAFNAIAEERLRLACSADYARQPQPRLLTAAPTAPPKKDHMFDPGRYPPPYGDLLAV